MKPVSSERGPIMRMGGVILCGGRSSRMGRPKALLPFGSEVMLQRVVRVLADVVGPIAVVAAVDQELPALPAGVRVVRDNDEYLGPLAGIGLGLSALQDAADAAFCSSCDVPLLRPEFVRAMQAALGDNDVAAPREGEFFHPLAAVYRTALAGRIGELVAAGRRRPLDLLHSVRTAVIDVEELRSVDPQLDSLRNVNTPEEYEAVRRDAGLA